MAKPDPDIKPGRFDSDMPDYSDPGQDDFAALARDLVPVRSMKEDDLDAIVRIDKSLTGRARREYYRAKLRDVMRRSGIRVSLIAEVDGAPAGYVMARVDYGEFGRPEPAAVIDTIGVDPGHARKGIGHALMSQLMTNLATLHVETVRTEITWDNFGLLDFLAKHDFTPCQRLVLSKRVE